MFSFDTGGAEETIRASHEESVITLTSRQPIAADASPFSTIVPQQCPCNDSAVGLDQDRYFARIFGPGKRFSVTFSSFFRDLPPVCGDRRPGPPGFLAPIVFDVAGNRRIWYEFHGPLSRR